ncbi:MAG: glycosyltransferase family 4 protein [Puniceicoccaceae bacterium]
MRIWIVNPFDELPGETDLPQRYWALSRELARQGHDVLWWSSDFSHRRKQRRAEPPSADGFRIRLIPTPPYRRNVGIGRLRNHRAFARGFRQQALAALESGDLAPPDRIVVSLPPLETAGAAFAVRDWADGQRADGGRRAGGLATRQRKTGNGSNGAARCEVIVDIMDAWPETFYRLIPLPGAPRQLLARILLAHLHRRARDAYRNADRISAVGDRYLELARRHAPSHTPMHRCYHGTDLETLETGPEDDAEEFRRAESLPRPAPIHPAKGGPPTSPSALPPALRLAYIGALERSYDLETVVEGLRRLSRDGVPVTLDIAGAGSRAGWIGRLASETPFIRFHGLLNRADLRALLASCHLGVIPLSGDSWVGLPYKIADYAAAGLPVLSSLDGECRRLLETKKAGTYYRPGSAEEFRRAVRRYVENPEDLRAAALNSRRMAEDEFDRARIYPALADFLTRPQAGR